jgi:membrane-associated phospholipid phosphatase
MAVWADREHGGNDRARTQSGHWRDTGADRWLSGTAALSAACAAVLYFSAGYHAGFGWLNSWSQWLPPLFWEAVTALGDEHVTLSLVLLAARRQPQFVWALFCSLLLGLAYSQGLKHGIGTLRPPAVLPAGSFNLAGPALETHSFPSGHTQLAFGTVGVLLYFIKGSGARTALLLLAALVGVSRIALGVHWPVDALTGAFGGALGALLGLRLSQVWHWGMGPTGRRTLVLLLALFPLQLLMGHDGGLTLIAPLLYLVALVSLAVAAQDHLLPILLRQRTHRDGGLTRILH